jgi:hypothetical protein
LTTSGWLSTHSIELKCSGFYAGNWDVLGDVYQCRAEGNAITITDRSDRTIHAVTGTHKSGKSNQDVKAAWLYNSNIFHFPLGLQNFFINLEAIAISNSHLKEVRKEDLKEHTKLRYLDLNDNDLEFIEAGLFDNNPKLELIDLHGNKLTHVDSTAFNNFVGKLKYLWLSRNVCQFEDANNIQKADQIIAKVQTGSCKDNNFLRHEDLKNVIKELANVMIELKSELKEAKEEIKEVKEGLKNVTAAQQSCSCADNDLEKRVKFLENAVGVDPQHHNQP